MLSPAIATTVPVPKLRVAAIAVRETVEATLFGKRPGVNPLNSFIQLTLRLVASVTSVTAPMALMGRVFTVALFESTKVEALLQIVPVILATLVSAGCGPPTTDLSTRAVAIITPFVVNIPLTTIPRTEGTPLNGTLIFTLLWVITTLLVLWTTLLTPLMFLPPLTPVTTCILP